jgi:hypothetical protein
MLCTVMQKAIILSVFIMSVVTLSVVAPTEIMNQSPNNKKCFAFKILESRCHKTFLSALKPDKLERLGNFFQLNLIFVAVPDDYHFT